MYKFLSTSCKITVNNKYPVPLRAGLFSLMLLSLLVVLDCATTRSEENYARLMFSLLKLL